MEQVLGTTKALADGNRLRVVMALTDQEELCVCQITELLNLAMPTVSRHMSVLQKAGEKPQRQPMGVLPSLRGISFHLFTMASKWVERLQ